MAAAGKAADEIELKELEIKEGVHEVEDASDALRFRDDGYIELVLRIMGYMCDGHNTVLQVSISLYSCVCVCVCVSVCVCY